MFLVRARMEAVGRASEAEVAVPSGYVPCRGTPAQEGRDVSDRIAVLGRIVPRRGTMGAVPGSEGHAQGRGRRIRSSTSAAGSLPPRATQDRRATQDPRATQDRFRRRPSRGTRPDHHASLAGRRSVLDTLRLKRVKSATRLRKEGPSRLMGQTDRERQFVAIAVRADGTRVPVRLPHNVEVSLLSRLEVLALELIGLITGSRRESGDRRR